jgi:hypothetical protein
MHTRDSHLPNLVRALVASGSVALLLGVPGTLAARPAAAVAGEPQDTPFPVETAKAERAMNQLQQALLAKLKTAMENGGPAAAVEVCRTEARTIADEVAGAQAIELGRTSHRLRNPANAPRPWARAVVDGSAGVKAAAERLRVVDLGDRVGVLRPIGTAEMCVRCHGPSADVRRNLGAALAAAYPQDRATEFAPGDLRGWMWAEVPKGAK